MSFEVFRRALDDVEERAYCEGRCRATEPLAIMLPDGDLAGLDKAFVGWLAAHAEPAPFGVGNETRVDKRVRDAMRIVARGKAVVHGFEPAAILDDIEAVLSPTEHLDATLTDILVYRPGGHFRRHKDTPRERTLVGTLIVGLPIAHEGGAFTVHDGTESHEVDWSGAVTAPDALRWCAMFSDADHEIAPVTKGARVTLVYALSQSGRPRRDPTVAKRLAAVDKLAAKLAVPAKSPLLIACARHVITDGRKLLQGIDVLRGGDRQIADVLVARGFDVKVRACITYVDGGRDANDDEHPARLPAEQVYTIARLDRPITTKDLAKIERDTCTFAERASYDGEPMGAGTFAPFILDSIGREQWIIRAGAAATLIHEADTFDEDGVFGNEGHEAHIYTLAAMEVTRPKVRNNKR